MGPCIGPWSQKLDEFNKSFQDMPRQYKSSFGNASKNTLDKLCDPDILHVWETDSDIDHLLQLSAVIAKLGDLGNHKSKTGKGTAGSMVIIVEEKTGRHNFNRVCLLVKYLTGVHGSHHLEGTIAAFGGIVVVRGWNNTDRSESAGQSADDTVKRVNIAIDRVFKIGKFSSGKKKLVWHHGAVVHFILYWINNTTSALRSALSAITVTGSLDLADSIKPSALGRMNTLSDLQHLEKYAKKLDCPVAFLDCSSQSITFPYLTRYMFFYAYYINTFLPADISRPHLYKAQDELVTFAFQVLGASIGKTGDRVVQLVKEHLDRNTAKKWARRCIDPRSYEKKKCRAAGKDEDIDRAVHLADGPFAQLDQTQELTAFARLAVGPAASGSTEYYTAAPVEIDFAQSRFRPSNPATFYILLPSKSQDLEKVTDRIQGLMAAVLARILQEKGNPVLGDKEKDMWKAVVKSCLWAFGESKGKMPKGVDEKVKFVRWKLTDGTWGHSMGAPKYGDAKSRRDGDTSDAARANAEAVQAYGQGGYQYGQPQSGGPQQMGVAGYGQQQQYLGVNPAYVPQHGVAAPQNSPTVGPPPMNAYQGVYAPPQGHGYGLGYGGSAPGYGQQRMDAGYVQNQGVGGTHAQAPQHGHTRGSHRRSRHGAWP